MTNSTTFKVLLFRRPSNITHHRQIYINKKIPKIVLFWIFEHYELGKASVELKVPSAWGNFVSIWASACAACWCHDVVAHFYGYYINFILSSKISYCRITSVLLFGAAMTWHFVATHQIAFIYYYSTCVCRHSTCFTNFFSESC